MIINRDTILLDHFYQNIFEMIVVRNPNTVKMINTIEI